MKVNPLLYLKAAKRLTSNFVSGHKSGLLGEEDAAKLIPKLAFYYVKYLTTRTEPEFVTEQEAKDSLFFYWLVLQMFSLMTPNQFVNVFPIKKFYKGHKYGIKDYNTTKAMLSKVDMDKPIGDKVIEFLWEYVNDDIEEFLVKYMILTSCIRRFEGKTTLAEEMAKDLGIKTYKLCQDSQGKKFLFDVQTGKTLRVRERPKHLKVIKGRG
ncbi:hypothetical protein [Anaerocellum danielii]|uniref:Uncharacterized protein n=1 Tax=Anaerocellum danielii TaxID=1387557 RepID=A0ABZ0TYC0_9FIRM|nr:hypothetical protein [Caldicellulosiruptor danielii]WPX08239.1 hypothetical protein SOJ16_002106 [Caldicellulosiruptor danielii]